MPRRHGEGYPSPTSEKRGVSSVHVCPLSPPPFLPSLRVCRTRGERNEINYWKKDEEETQREEVPHVLRQVSHSSTGHAFSAVGHGVGEGMHSIRSEEQLP